MEDPHAQASPLAGWLPPTQASIVVALYVQQVPINKGPRRGTLVCVSTGARVVGRGLVSGSVLRRLASVSLGLAACRFAASAG